METATPAPTVVMGDVLRIKSSREGSSGFPGSGPGLNTCLINIRWVDAWMDDEWAWGQGKEEGGGLPTSQELLVGTDRADTDFLVDDIHTAEAERDRGTGPGRNVSPILTCPTGEPEPQPLGLGLTRVELNLGVH